MAKPVLRLENLVVNYGHVNALKGISLEVNRGEIVTLIGSNGAGKTTTMNSVMGLKECAGGKVFVGEEDMTNADTLKMVKHGVILSPEGRQVFPRFTVMDNLLMGGYLKTNEENSKQLDVVYKLFPLLRERTGQVAETLSGGEQQMLAVGRAMMGDPDLLLLDEPSLGLAPLIVKEIFDLIVRIREMGKTIVLVEQNAKMALKVSDRGYVLETGRIVLADRAETLLNSPAVREAYLGGL